MTTSDTVITKDKVQERNLVAQHIPLTGKHLIEASAGTGKTFNITRIYLRLLLEQQLEVQQILVMTFTKDATQELRGRIDTFIRQALNHWDELVLNDPYFIEVATRIEASQAKLLLKKALLFLDEAAIFTIHGFCKSVLTQHAFATGVAFNSVMETDSHDITLQACQDWYRTLSQENTEHFVKVAEFWPEPASLLSQFSKAIYKPCTLALLDKSTLIEDFQQNVDQALNSLISSRDVLVSYLIDGKPVAEQEKRQIELSCLLDWLALVKQDYQHIANKIPDAFIDGRRFSRSAVKEELIEIFSPVNQVKTSAKNLLSLIAKAEALVIVRQGIYTIRAQVTKQKQALNILTFDDLISTLADKLASSDHKVLRDILFEQYPVALVDEFQDTDPLQFSILKSLYYQQEHASLFMIGDPKQAIYGFRGGDVFAYLSARADCEYSWLMDTNWRSSQAMITGYNRLFFGNSLTEKSRDIFSYGIDYFPVLASINAGDKQLNDKQYHALQFVHFVPENQKGSVKQAHRSEMATWCSNEIIRLLSNDSFSTDAEHQADDIQASDIAILVRDGAEAADIKLAFEQAGLASVFLSNRANLLKSKQTLQLIQLLKGILFVENERLFSAALACSLLPFSPDKFYQLQHDELAWQEMKFTFAQLRQEWLSKGFITMALQLMHNHMQISSTDNDRILTNLLHLFELLQAASQRHKQPQELLYWFEQQSKADNPDVETELRLESEDNLIRIITQHGSKGLEYKIVFVPFATRHKNPLKFGNRNVSLIEYHQDNGELILSLDGSERAKKAMADEAYAESIRLLYVAVTRAEKRCYLFTTTFDGYHLSPLGQVAKWQKDSDIIHYLQELVTDNPEAISVEVVDQAVIAQQYIDTTKQTNQPHVTTFNGKIERDWWLSSFTALSRNIRDNGVSTPDRDGANELKILQTEHNIDSELLRFCLTKGAHTGNLLHDILEKLDFCQPNWQAAFSWPLLKFGELPQGYQELDLENWLSQVLITPMKSNVESLTLATIEQSKTIREAEFYFPLNNASTEQLAILLTDHRNVSSSVNAKVSRVVLPNFKQLKGMMHGFIDLIFEHQGKYYICDYKSNHLGDDFSCYQHEQLKQNIEQHHYDLQYLIYSVALHRYLKLNLPGYDINQHFGGTYYLYLRGMSPEIAHQGCGVYHREITEQELLSLDEIFSGTFSKVGR